MIRASLIRRKNPEASSPRRPENRTSHLRNMSARNRRGTLVSRVWAIVSVESVYLRACHLVADREIPSKISVATENESRVRNRSLVIVHAVSRRASYRAGVANVSLGDGQC